MTKKLLLFLLFTAVVCAQSRGPVSITSTQCASIATDQMATVFFQVTGTWTGTLQPTISVKGQTPANIQVTPAASNTPQSTVTASGAYFARVAGYNTFQVCGNTVSAGTAVIYLNASPAAR